MPNDIAVPTIARTGVLFRPGNYGDKGTYTEADIEGMCGDVNVPIRMSHYPTLLEGKLGHCNRAFVGFDADGTKVLMGEWSEPEPLSQLLGDGPRPLSVEIDMKSKKLHAVALEVKPHIKDAAFFSAAVNDAYAKFSAGEEVKPLASFAYESASERDAIDPADFGDPNNLLFPCRTQQELRQCLDELAYADDPTAVKQRLEEIAGRKGLKIPDAWWRQTRGVSKPLADDSDVAMYSQEERMNPTVAATPQEEQPKGFMEQLRALFTGAKPEELEAAETVLTTAKTGKTPRELELEQKLAKFEADEATKQATANRDAAIKRADQLVIDGKIEAKGNEQYEQTVAAFMAAGELDIRLSSLACFSSETPAPANFSLTAYLDDVCTRLKKFDGSEQVGGMNGKTAVFEQSKTTVTDPVSGEIAEFSSKRAQEIIDEANGVKKAE